MSLQSEISSVELEEIAKRIRFLRKRATEHAVEMGQALIDVKSRLPHGEFVKWVEAQCGFKIRMAQDLMKLARETAPGSDLAAIMTPSTLRIYVANRSRPAVQDLVKARAAGGQRVSRKELLTLIGNEQTHGSASKQTRQSVPRRPAKLDLLTPGETDADTELNTARRVAELLLQRLSSADLEFIMDGMNWSVWNRVLVWLRADTNLVTRGSSASPACAAGAPLGTRAA